MTEVGQLVDARRQVFVAYSYRDYPAVDYRKVFTEIADEYSVSFVFADEKITNMHIMQKIISYIRGSDFSLFDISGWNPNVTLELGIAMASEEDWYITFNPEKTNLSEVPSDLRGIDRIQYSSYGELGDKLRVLIEQRYPKRTNSIDSFLEELRTQILEVLRAQGGLTMVELAEVVGSSVGVTQLAVRPLVGEQLATTGRRKAMKYYISGDQFETTSSTPGD